MLSEEHSGYACELRRLLRKGALGVIEATVDLGSGVTLPLHTAVRIALNDLDELTGQEQEGREIDPGRWQRLGSDPAYLYWLAIQGR